MVTIFYHRNEPEISMDVIEHILKSTMCFVYLKLGEKKNLIKTFEEVKHLELHFDAKKSSTLLGCKGISWHKFERKKEGKAEIFFRQAIKDNPNCHFWYFYLGEKLRDIRRDLKITTTPGNEEVECFEKTYQMNQNIQYATWIAQMYRENRNFSKAEEIYEHVFETILKKETTASILLRLALGFIQLKQFKKAKACLDRVKKSTSRRSMYNHYMAIYNLKQNRHQVSILYF